MDLFYYFYNNPIPFVIKVFSTVQFNLLPEILEDIPLVTNNLELQEALVEQGPCTIQIIYQENEPSTSIVLCEPVPEKEEQTVTAKPAKNTSRFAECWTPGGFECPTCKKVYRARRNLARHIDIECGKEPKFVCPFCNYKNHRKNEIMRHVKNKHNTVSFEQF